jgi:glycosyltransferase involved in cell wall biosynthesis
MSIPGKYRKRRLSICFVSKRSPQRYKSLDLEILSRHFEVIKHDYLYTLPNFLGFFRKLNTVHVVFSWFASPWMALARFLLPSRVKLVVVAGGYDVANCRELKHGARFHPVSGGLTKLLLKKADMVLPVSRFNCEELLSLTAPKSFQTVYNSLDMPEFSVLKDVNRPQRVITVGIIGQFISKCKGHYRFIEVARQLPGFEFVLLGKKMDSTAEALQQTAPDNVSILDYEDREQLVCELLNSSVYLQLSYYESFGVSVAEAIACGCYPIVARGSALEEVTCGMGEALDAGDVEAVARSVVRAVREERFKHIEPKRVREKFSVQKRENQLVKVIENVYRGNA